MPVSTEWKSNSKVTAKRERDREETNKTLRADRTTSYRPQTAACSRTMADDIRPESNDNVMWAVQ